MRTATATLVLALLALALPGTARPVGAAEAKYVMRLATVAPKGSAWAHELDAMAEEIATNTHGEVKIKIFYGGAAGSEIEVAERIKKGQLDGAISGGWLCRRVMPSMRVLGMVGVFQSRDEATHVITALNPTLEKEANEAGFVLFGTAGVGTVVIFSREPITSLDELRKTKLWRWEGEEVELLHGNAMGLNAVPSSLVDAAKAYKEGRVDGFYAVPMAALAFQWFAQVKYVTDLKTGYLQGCIIASRSAVDALPQEYRDVFRKANAKLVLRFNVVGQEQEDTLLGGVFERQGLKPVPVSAKFRAEFFDAARVARDELQKSEKLVPKALLTRVLELLADYRAEHKG